MKVKALINCTGIGYEDFKVDEVREIDNSVAKVLIDFGYAEEEKKKVVKKED